MCPLKYYAMLHSRDEQPYFIHGDTIILKKRCEVCKNRSLNTVSI